MKRSTTTKNSKQSWRPGLSSTLPSRTLPEYWSSNSKDVTDPRATTSRPSRASASTTGAYVVEDEYGEPEEHTLSDDELFLQQTCSSTSQSHTFQRPTSKPRWESSIAADTTWQQEQDIFDRYQIRDLMDQNNDEVLVKAKQMLQCWAQEQQQEEKLEEEQSKEPPHQPSMEGDYRWAQRVQELYQQVHAPPKKSKSLAGKLPKRDHQVQVPAAATKKVPICASQKETPRPVDIVQARLKQQGELLLFKRRKAEERTREQEKQRKLKVAYAKADQLANLYRLQCIRKAFTGWQHDVLQTKLQLETCQKRQQWLQQSRAFRTWKCRKMERVHDRILLVERMRRKRELEMESRAVMVYGTTLCKHSESFILPQGLVGEENSLNAFRASVSRKKEQLLETLTKTLQQPRVQPKMISEPSAHEAVVKEPPAKMDSKGHTTSAPFPKSVPIKTTTNNIPVIKSIHQPSKYLEGMAKREQARQQRREQVQQRKQEQQAELERLAQEEQLRKQEQERLEKEADRQRRKQKLVQQKEEALRKEQERLHRLDQFRHAHAHNTQRCLRAGWNKFQRVREKHKRWDKEATRVYQTSLQGMHWEGVRKAWMWRLHAKMDGADLFHGTRQLQRFWNTWKNALSHYHTVAQQAPPIHARNLTRTILQRWQTASHQRKQQTLDWECSMEHRIRAFETRRLQQMALGYWKQFLKESKEQKWRAYRMDVMRNRARDLLLHSKLEKGLREIE